VDAVGRRCAAAGQGDAAEQAGACGAGVCESAAWKEAEGAKGGPKRVKAEKVEKARKRDSGQAGLVLALSARISGS